MVAGGQVKRLTDAELPSTRARARASVSASARARASARDGGDIMMWWQWASQMTA